MYGYINTDYVAFLINEDTLEIVVETIAHSIEMEYNIKNYILNNMDID